MELLIAILLGILAFFLADYLARRVGMPETIGVIVAALVGVIVFFSTRGGL